MPLDLTNETYNLAASWGTLLSFAPTNTATGTYGIVARGDNL